MTSRRGFMGAILAAAVAPISIKAEILMPVKQIIVPKYFDGIDDVLPLTGALWYDPGNLSTLFQDIHATIPVTAVGQFVARMNDVYGRGTPLLVNGAAKLERDAGGRLYVALGE